MCARKKEDRAAREVLDLFNEVYYLSDVRGHS
jgi:hypothetical protein